MRTYNHVGQIEDWSTSNVLHRALFRLDTELVDEHGITVRSETMNRLTHAPSCMYVTYRQTLIK